MPTLLKTGTLERKLNDLLFSFCRNTWTQSRHGGEKKEKESPCLCVRAHASERKQDCASFQVVWFELSRWLAGRLRSPPHARPWLADTRQFFTGKLYVPVHILKLPAEELLWSAQPRITWEEEADGGGGRVKDWGRCCFTCLVFRMALWTPLLFIFCVNQTQPVYFEFTWEYSSEIVFVRPSNKDWNKFCVWFCGSLFFDMSTRIIGGSLKITIKNDKK